MGWAGIERQSVSNHWHWCHRKCCWCRFPSFFLQRLLMRTFRPVALAMDIGTRHLAGWICMEPHLGMSHFTFWVVKVPNPATWVQELWWGQRRHWFCMTMDCCSIDLLASRSQRTRGCWEDGQAKLLKCGYAEGQGPGRGADEPPRSQPKVVHTVVVVGLGPLNQEAAISSASSYGFFCHFLNIFLLFFSCFF
jgi:hypothetical protein